MPSPFLEIITHDLSLLPGLSGSCAGFEQDEWRSKQLAAHLMEWLPDFALNHKEKESLSSENAVALLQKAAQLIYTTDKFQKRGEFGELLLHVLLRQVFDTLPAISKIFYKDSTNNTVKGFDAVHVVATPANLELWLGEVKFYSKISLAISHVMEELKTHTEEDYLRREFLMIANKIEDSWPHSDRLRRLLDKGTSLDTVFDALCIPVLLTYDSPIVAGAKKSDAGYRAAIDKEFRTHHASFLAAGPPKDLKVHLFLLPMNSKSVLVKCLEERLKTWQKIA